MKINAAIYCDGSCPMNAGSSPETPAGWGFVVVKRDDIFEHTPGREWVAEYGAVVVDPRGAGYEGAEHGSNQTAELTAAIKALAWAYHRRDAIGRLALFTDSKYVKNLLLRQWKWDDNGEMDNKALVLRARDLQDDVDARVRWVKGHSGIYWNERADGLAREGLLVAKQKMKSRKG